MPHDANEDYALRGLLQTTVQEVLEAEVEDALGATKGERTGKRRGARSGYNGRKLTTRIGTLELRVPQDRGGLFRAEVFTRYQRSEKALLLALAGSPAAGEQKIGSRAENRVRPWGLGLRGVSSARSDQARASTR